MNGDVFYKEMEYSLINYKLKNELYNAVCFGYLIREQLNHLQMLFTDDVCKYYLQIIQIVDILFQQFEISFC